MLVKSGVLLQFGRNIKDVGALYAETFWIWDRSRIILAFFTQDRLERFIPELLGTLENAVKVEKDSEGNVFVTDLDAKYLIVNQDEKSHHSNDVQK